MTAKPVQAAVPAAATPSAEQDPDLIVITLRPLASRVPWPCRLRQLLKHALRYCGMRNEGIDYIRSPEPPMPRLIDRDDADGDDEL
jgi:hypothetical protein